MPYLVGQGIRQPTILARPLNPTRTIRDITLEIKVKVNKANHMVVALCYLVISQAAYIHYARHKDHGKIIVA